MKHINGWLYRAVLTLLCYIVNRIKITVRLRLVKVVSGWAVFDILVGFQILAIIYAAHQIMWQLLRGILISTAAWHAWEYNEKNDVQKVKSMWNKNLRWERTLSKRLKNTGPNVSLWNRAACAQPLAGSIALPYYSTSCYYATGLSQQLDSASFGPANKQPTVSEMPTGTSPAQLLFSSTLDPTW